MKKNVLQLIMMIFIGFFMNCGEVHSEGEKFEERVFVVNTVDNQERLKEYLAYHEQIWPEVEAGFRKAGYQEIALYHFNDLIVMKIKVPKGADLDEMGKLAESYNPKCREWNVLMDTYQKGVNGTTANQKWVEAVPFYQFTP